MARFFKPEEFDSPDALGSGINMDPAFLEVLDLMRAECGFPFVVLSGYRTPARNKGVGGVNDSSHEKGLAADIEIIGSDHRSKFLTACFHFGVTRIGIGATSIHIDMDTTKPQNVVWYYTEDRRRV